MAVPSLFKPVLKLSRFEIENISYGLRKKKFILEPCGTQKRFAETDTCTQDMTVALLKLSTVVRFN